VNDTRPEMNGTDDLKGFVLLTDCCTAVKAAHNKTLMSKELRIAILYGDADDGGGDAPVRTLTLWYWPKMRQATACVVVTWAVPPCPMDSQNNWSMINGGDLYEGKWPQYAVLTECGDMFKPSEWIKKLQCAPPVSNGPGEPHEDEALEDEGDDDELSFLVDKNETYALFRKPIKDVCRGQQHHLNLFPSPAPCISPSCRLFSLTLCLCRTRGNTGR
jgi:hypothetical protein